MPEPETQAQRHARLSRQITLDLDIAVRYVPDNGDGYPWVCEVQHHDDDVPTQGWGPDPLAAALTCASWAYVEGVDLVDRHLDMTARMTSIKDVADALLRVINSLADPDPRLTRLTTAIARYADA